MKEKVERALLLKEGMRMHPFLDRSGLVFFDPKRTLVSSLSVTEEVFYEWLSSPSNLSEQEVELLNTLIQQGFVVNAADEKQGPK